KGARRAVVLSARNDGCCSRSNGFILTIFHSQAGDLRRNDDSCVARVACAGTWAQPSASALSDERAVRFGLAAGVQRGSVSADHRACSWVGSAVQLARQRERGEGDASLVGAIGLILESLGRLLGEFKSASRLRSGIIGTTGAECGVETWDLFVSTHGGDRRHLLA